MNKELQDYPALRKPRMAAGIGAKTATTIWSIVLALAIVIGLPWGLVAVIVGGIAHVGLKWLFMKDSRIVALYMVYEMVPNDLLSGFPGHREKANTRPIGFARRLPIA